MPKKGPKSVPVWVWVGAGIAALVAVVWYERRKAQSDLLNAATQEAATTGQQVANPFMYGASPSGSNTAVTTGSTPATPPVTPPVVTDDKPAPVAGAGQGTTTQDKIVETVTGGVTTSDKNVTPVSVTPAPSSVDLKVASQQTVEQVTGQLTGLGSHPDKDSAPPAPVYAQTSAPSSGDRAEPVMMVPPPVLVTAAAPPIVTLSQYEAAKIPAPSTSTPAPAVVTQTPAVVTDTKAPVTPAISTPTPVQADRATMLGTTVDAALAAHPQAVVPDVKTIPKGDK